MVPLRILAALGLSAALVLSGCAAAVTAWKHKDLDVQTRMSESVFLEPIPPAERTVWIEIKNTSDQDVPLTGLAEALAAKGYTVVSDPDAAHYRLQINVLYAGTLSQAALDKALAAGYGGPVLGAGAGAAATGSLRGAAAGALAGGAAELLAGALVKAVTHTVITDVQLSERAPAAVVQSQTVTLRQGSPEQQSRVHQTVTEAAPWRRHRTRVVAAATQVNLRFEAARPVLLQRLTHSLAGLF